MDFEYYQERTWSTDSTKTQSKKGLVQITFGLAEKIGAIMGCLKKRVRDGEAYETFEDDLAECIGDTTWYLASLCSHLGIDFDGVARRNLVSTEARWLKPEDSQPALFSTLFDEDYPEQEQLPRQFRVRFVECNLPDRSWLPMTEVWVDGQRFGDAIDDNAALADHYRLHDVLHISNAAILGWSPVVRSLLRRKRKSNPHVDKYEDGARAQDAEEALSSLIHNEARRNSYFDGVNVIDTAFLIKAQSLVAHLEVGSRTMADWQHCILEAYRVFRLFRVNNGGVVDVSLVDHSLKFQPDTG